MYKLERDLPRTLELCRALLSDTPLPWNPEHTNPPGGLPRYFQDNVIGGPGSFVIVAEDFKSFGQALISKMIAEIATLPATRRHAAMTAAGD